MIHILIADDHGLYRRGLRLALEESIFVCQVSEAGNMDAVLSRLAASPPLDLVLFDLCMPGLSSFDTLRVARECFPATRMAILSASSSRADIVNALEARLDGFISKLQSDEEIVAAVRDVLLGRIYVTSLMGDVDAPSSRASHWPGPASAPVNIARLTPRQRELLPLLAHGLSNKEIGRALKITEATTKIHVAALMRTLGARNRTEAAVMSRPIVAAADKPEP